MRRWQHEDTGRICEAVHSPGNRWYEIPRFEAEIKAQQSTVGESAQPRIRAINPELTIRDYFAGMAMQVIMATGKRELSFHEVADAAFRQADATVNRGREGA